MTTVTNVNNDSINNNNDEEENDEELTEFDELLDKYCSKENEHENPYVFIEYNDEYFDKHKDDLPLFIQFAYFSWSERKVDDIMKTILDDIANYYEQPNKQSCINRYYSFYEKLHKTDEAILKTIERAYNYCLDSYSERQMKNMRPIVPIHDCYVSSIGDNGFTMKLRDSVREEIENSKK